MKKLVLLVVVLCSILISSVAMAAEISSDKMILEWTTNKVWMVGNELCVQGTFVNKRNDVRVTKLNDFEMKFVFILDDGSQVVHVAKPKSLPICKIPPNSIKSRVSMNFGKYEGAWKKWVTTSKCWFSYIEM